MSIRGPTREAASPVRGATTSGASVHDMVITPAFRGRGCPTLPPHRSTDRQRLSHQGGEHLGVVASGVVSADDAADPSEHAHSREHQADHIGAHARPGAGDASPDADGERPTPLAHRSDERGERQGHGRGGPDPLHRTRDDEHPRFDAHCGEG